MSDKAPDAYRTISEAAEALDLPAHVLRFWESRFSQIKPVKRAGGRRLYRPGDLQLLRGIRALLYEQGYTIKGAQKYLRENGVAAVSALADGQAAPVVAAPSLSERYVATPGPASGASVLDPIIAKLTSVKSDIDAALQARAND